MLRSSKFLALLLFLNISYANGQGITPVGGGGGGGGSGTVTSIATSCGVSGGPITTTGTIQGNATPNPQTGTSYAILDVDCGKLLTLSNGSAVAVSIAQAGTAGSFASGWFVTVKNLGAGTVTITPTTSTIDGAANLALTTNQSIDLYSNGTNYIAGRGISGSSSGANPTATASDTAVNGAATTFMRSDGAPAIQKASSSQFGLVEVDNTSIVSTVGVITGLGPHPGYNTTNWYLPQGHATLGGGGTSTANRIMCSMGYIANKITINNLGIRINVLGTSNIQLALYTNVGGVPGALLSSTGSFVNTATGFFSAALGANQQVGPTSTSGPWIWFCFNVNDSTVALTGYNGTSGIESAIVGAATGANAIGNGSATIVGKQCTGAACQGGSSTFNTWPANLNTSTFTDVTSAIATTIAFQAVSIP